MWLSLFWEGELGTCHALKLGFLFGAGYEVGFSESTDTKASMRDNVLVGAFFILNTKIHQLMKDPILSYIEKKEEGHGH
jgi:hypothetical protein